MESTISKRNLFTVMFVGFVNYLEWSIVMASIFPFIKKVSHKTEVSQQTQAQVYLSLAQSLFPLGQGISQPVSSTMVKKLGEVKIVLLVTLVTAVVGNVMYMAAPAAHTVVLIIAGRAVAGLGAGSGGIAYGFIGANTPRESRAKYMGYYRVTCMMGVLVGTLAATFLSHFGETEVGKATGVDEYTAPAVITIGCLVIALFLVVFVLDESACTPLGDRDNTHSSIRSSLRSRGVIIGLMMFFLNGFITTWVGYIMPLIAYNHLHWQLNIFGWLMVGVSGTAAVGSLATAFLGKAKFMKKDGERRVIGASYALMVVGIVLAYLSGPSILRDESHLFKQATFVSGVILIFLMYSVCGVMLPSLTTKFVDKAMMPVIMPYCIAAMSVGKVIAPLLSKAEQLIQGWDLLFISTACIAALGLLLFLCLYRAPTPEETPLLEPGRRTGAVEGHESGLEQTT